jgi:hypothetical protein
MIRTGVFFWTAESVVNFLRDLALDSWCAIEPQLVACEDMIFIFPNVSLSGLSKLKEELSTMANADSIDMTCLVYGHDSEGAEIVSDRWEFGFNDGSSSVSVRIYAKEYFTTNEDLLKLISRLFG